MLATLIFLEYASHTVMKSFVLFPFPKMFPQEIAGLPFSPLYNFCSNVSYHLKTSLKTISFLSPLATSNYVFIVSML